MPENPLDHLSGGSVKLDRRHDRQTLAEDLLRSVIAAARHSGRPFRGLSGPDRSLLYCVACASGFRAEELASLCPPAFDLDATPPTVTLAATDAKNGTTAVQPLPADVASALRGYLAGRAADRPVWPGTWFKKAAEMLRIELDACGIPYVVEGPDGPLYADFHSLRHSYIALLDKSGATLKEAMQLARHSDPKLTMAVYGRAQLHDLGQAVDKLPALLGDRPGAALQATGTASGCSMVAQPVDRGRLDVRPVEGGGEQAQQPQPLDSEGVEADEDHLIPLERTPRVGLEPTTNRLTGVQAWSR
jgi:integrase